jgi:transcriptional regulatory protein RtcR
MNRQLRVGYGFLGTTLDAGGGADRWSHWRPTVSIFQQEDFSLDRYHLIYGTRYKKMASMVKADIAGLSPETELVDHELDFRNPWDFEEVYEKMLDLMEEQVFDPEDEELFFHITTGTHVGQICIFLLCESRKFPGKLLQTGPNRGDHRTNEGSVTVIDLDLSRYDSIASRFRREAENDTAFLKSGIQTRNPAFNTLIAQIEKVSVRSREPILLMGPTGAGKSRLARRIYELRTQRIGMMGAFVEVNCATLRGDSAMSNLFGHIKGSFTGAMQDRKGFLKQADHGMVFLDEIGELGLDEQAMLLHAIEEKTFISLGADTETRSDFTLICGTNRDLAEEVTRGTFREDLLARINLWSFRLPGLRERPEDIAPNLQFELDSFEKSSGTRVTFNKEALERFLTWAESPEAAWKANFRDLNGAVKRLCALAPSARITVEEVKEEIERLRDQWKAPPRRGTNLPQNVGALDEFDRIQLEGVLQVCRRHPTMAEAGRELFAVSRLERSTVNDSDRLKKYLARFGLSWEIAHRFPTT